MVKGQHAVNSVLVYGKGLTYNKLSYQHTSGGAIAVGLITAMELRELKGLLPFELGADIAME